MDAKRRALSATFLDTMENIERHNREVIGQMLSVGLINISTMTIVCKLSIERVDLPLLVRAADATQLQHKGCEIAVKSAPPPNKVRKNSKQDSVFLNQVTLSFRDSTSKKSIKVFGNGTLHVTGCKSVHECMAVAETVCAIVGGTTTDDVTVADFEVEMINSNFGCNTPLNLVAMKEVLLEWDVQCSYEPDIYPGLNIKCTGLCSILVFQSGNIIVTGLKTFPALFEAYSFITAFICKHLERVQIKMPAALAAAKAPSRRRRAAHTALVHGYPESLYFSCV